jgi:proteasome accessory factor B
MNPARKDKAERLVNLTMALLETRRPLGKEEIFANVAGYSGTPEAMERMFERDKDDLRDLNIEILVEAKDKYFDDEVGYRIAKVNFEMPATEFTSSEIYWLSVAANIWRGAALENLAQDALLKIQSTNAEYLPLEPLASMPIIQTSEPIFFALWSSINHKELISFQYKGIDGVIAERKVAPYSLVSRRGHWYLIAKERSSNEFKRFRLSRFQSQPEIISDEDAYEISADYDVNDYIKDISEHLIEKAELLIKPGCGSAIRQLGKFELLKSDDVEWERIQLKNVDFDLLVYNILWCGPDVKVINPETLVKSVTQSLSEVLSKHGAQ